MNGPHAGDVQVPVPGVELFVEPQLADELDDAVLDATSTQDGQASFSSSSARRTDGTRLVDASERRA